MSPKMPAPTVTATSTSPASLAAAKRPAGRRAAYIGVGVATLWSEPGEARPVDRAAVSNPASIRRWQEDMTLGQKEWLVDRLETQALYGQEVILLEERGGWARVAVEGQPTPENAPAYPGWVPREQLADGLRLREHGDKPFAQVERSTALLHDARRPGGPSIEVSYGTRLPVVERLGDAILVATPDGVDRWASADDVSIYEDEHAIPRTTGKAVVEAAREFLGIEYLWAGTSAFGFDCSGFTYAIYKAHGITIPRDTVPEEKLAWPDHGMPVRYEDLQKGDLLYFAHQGGNGPVHHVGMYTGEGEMVHSPRPGSAVRTDDVEGSGWVEEFAGAIRHLDR